MENLTFLKDLAEGKGSWLSLVLAFAVLPAFYLKFSFDMQKEYVDLAKTMFSATALSRSERLKLVERSEEAIQVFQLEWGLVCAIAILILANFSATFMVDLSSFAQGCTTTGATPPTGQLGIACGKVKSLLSIYSILTVLMIFFQISWARTIAIRRLRKIYVELSVRKTKDQVKNGANTTLSTRRVRDRQ